MTRNAPLDLHGFDPDILDAARDVARRAGVPVETWIASIVTPDAGMAATDPKPAEPAAELDPAGRANPAGKAKPSASPQFPAPQDDEARFRDDALADGTGAPVQGRSEGPAAGFPDAIGEMMRRLDAIDRRIVADRKESQDATARSIETIEARLSTVLDTGLTPAAQMTQRLGEIEQRMIELGEQLAAPRPLGRRGRPVDAEVRDAVSEIRLRQRAIEASLSGATPPARPAAPSAAVAELQVETTRLRESIGGLASGRDVGALEQAMQSLVAGVQKAQEPADLAAIAEPIAHIQEQVAKLADEVAENVHVRVAADVERLAAKVDGAMQGGSAGLVEQDALAALFRELEEIRRLIAALAGPERIQSLAAGLHAISAQIAELQGGAAGGASSMAELRPLLEEIRSGLRRPSDSEGGGRIQVMGVDSDAIIHRIDALSEKVDRVGINPVGDLINRLEDLGATLRRPSVPEEDIASIHGMLHDLATKLDRIGTGEGPKGEGLDALEQQVLALARRLDSRDADPALAGLERTMSDLLAQVSALRADAPADAASAAGGSESGELGLLRASLADLRAQQAASEQRMQLTMTGVYSALERLVGHLGVLETEDAAAPRTAARVIPSASAVNAHRPPPQAASSGIGDLADLPLEPGAGRPGRERAPEGASVAAEGDIKTSFIAAARRAAQAAQAEASGAALTDATRDGRKWARGSAGADGATGGGGLTDRLRGEIDKRRKPLLLGLAAIVLVLGALQAVHRSRSGPAGSTAQVATETAAPPVTDQAAKVDPTIVAAPAAPPVPGGKTEAGGNAEPAARSGDREAPAPADPLTTQSLAEAAPVVSVPREIGTVPRVAGMNGLAAELSAVPTGFSKLRQAALDGDGAAIYELATRQFEGRGLPRDPASAARLYEKLAAAGYAPAQYKVASFYEKGTGVTRDPAQAKLWYGRAAEQGHARSMHNLAVIHAETPASGGKPDFAAAALWFRRAAEYGLRDSQYNLAVLYARGLGQAQDLVQSYLWFSAAAAQGDDDAARKRDDVAAKLDPKSLAAARSLVAGFKAKVPAPAVNEAPAMANADKTMTLLGAPAPIPAASRKG